MLEEYLFYLRKQLNTFISVLRQQAKITGLKHCPCCNHDSLIFWNKNYERKLRNLCQKWETGGKFTQKMIKRENHFCAHCLSSYRLRTHAQAIIKTLNHQNLSGLIFFLKEHPSFTIYEAANYWVFRNRKIKKLKNYIVSEFHPDFPFGKKIKGIRNENLERLSFKNKSFNLVITSEVLEHVANLKKVLLEIYRVLKPGGYHIFTTPVNPSLKKTKPRAKIEKGSKIEHLLPKIFHGDDISGGVLTFRDFGTDIDKIIKNHGFKFKEEKYYFNREHITSVYITQKT